MEGVKGKEKGDNMYYHLIHMNSKGQIHCEVYTIEGMAQEALRQHKEKGLIIAEPGVASFRNYGLCEDLIDHSDELQ